MPKRQISINYNPALLQTINRPKYFIVFDIMVFLKTAI
jgi:hypothetical protein